MEALKKRKGLPPQLDYQLRLDLTGAAGAQTGETYVDSLKDGRDVWLNGERVDVTTHPAFAGVLNEMSRLYDLQHADELLDKMTFVSPQTGNRVSRSYMLPETKSELESKWENSHLWMEHSWGQLPRVPDFMSNVVVGLYDFREELGAVDPRFRDNVVRYYHYCLEHDISITHAIGDPQIDRSSTPLDDPDLALRVIEEREDGVVIRGAKQLATLAPFAQELMIYMSPTFALRERPEFVIWCALPLATKGLKVLCREPHSMSGTGHSHPFASRYDEQDAMVFFDDVLVPWDRVFLLHDGQTALKGFSRLNAWSLYVGHIRFYHRLRTLLGVGSLVSKAIGVNQFREIQDMLGELTTYAEMIRVALVGMNAEAERTPGGLYAPGNTLATDSFAASIASRVTDIVREIGASGIIMQPSEADLAADELRPLLIKYMRGKEIDVDQKSRLFRLAWDLVGDSYGMRQEMYEKWYRGSLVRNRIALYHRYDKESIEARIKEMIEAPLFQPDKQQV